MKHLFKGGRGGHQVGIDGRDHRAERIHERLRIGLGPDEHRVVLSRSSGNGM